MTAPSPWHNARLAMAGRLAPPTVADAFVLNVASTWTPNLTVVVAAWTGDPIPSMQRLEWLGEMAPRAGLVPLDLPDAYPGPGPDATRLLANAIRDLTYLRPDALVGPGLRDVALARELAVPYIPIETTGLPCEVDAGVDLLASWEALPPAVRAGCVRRVVVLGPESTGKTTLAHDLAARFETRWAGEYLRLWLDAKGKPCEPDDLAKVVAGHQATEAALARLADRVLFCDTDPLMTAVYSRFYYGTVPAWLDEAAGARRGHLYLLLDCDVPWVPDPHRDAPTRRDEIRDLCVHELERRGLPWLLIKGPWAERLEQAAAAVSALLGRSPLPPALG